MSHIIGAPPKKRGTTFADVPWESLFVYKGTPMWKLVEETRQASNRSNARNSMTGGLAFFESDEPVTLLTPVEPEPDPAMTPHGELKPGIAGAYRLEGSTDVWVPGHHGCKPVRIRDGVHPHKAPECAVRILSSVEVAAHILEAAGAKASVVVHEEPGSHFSQDEDGHWCEFEGPINRADLEHVVRQATALLAQLDDSPASEPKCEREDCQAYQACAGECKPTEDRSKPAPEWARREKEYVYWHDISGLMLAPYGRGLGPGDGPVHGLGWEQLRGIRNQASRMLTAYDAQQAGKGGESDG